MKYIFEAEKPITCCFDCPACIQLWEDEYVCGVIFQKTKRLITDEMSLDDPETIRPDGCPLEEEPNA